MKRDTLIKILLCLLMVGIIIAVRFHCDKTQEPEDVKELVTPEKETQNTGYDSIVTYNTPDYQVDILYHQKHTRIVFRYLHEHDMFEVFITPVSTEFDMYKNDIIARFIDIHEHDKAISYEYYTTKVGNETREYRREITPVTRLFNVRLVHRLNEHTNQMETFLAFNHTLPDTFAGIKL